MKEMRYNTNSSTNSKNYFRIALQSALAAALCLGLPAGLLLWLILFQQMHHSVYVEKIVSLLQANGFNKIIVLAVSSLIWSFLLGRISGYRPWWKIGFGTGLGIIVGWLSPLSNLDGWLPGMAGTQLPIHALFAIAMCGIVFSATSSVGLAYGFLLRNLKVAITLALSTGLVSVLTLLLTIVIFDQFGIRVGGTVPLAMSKVTSVSLLMSAITGGMVLGVGFSWFAERDKTK